MSKIKDILSNYEGEFNPNGWSQLEKRLEKKSFWNKNAKMIISTTSCIIAIVASVLIFTYTNDEISTQNVNNEDVTQGILLQEETIAVQNENPTIALSNQNESNISTENKNYTYNKTVLETPKTITNEINIESEKMAISSEQTPDNPIQTEESAKNVAIVAEPTFSYNCDSKCTPAKVDFSAKNVEAGCKVVWNVGNGKLLTGENISFEYNKKGSFTPQVAVYKGDNLVISKELPLLEISKSPEVDFDWRNDQADYTFYTQRTVNLIYNWEIAGQNYTSKQVEHKFTRSGDYAVKLKLTNDKGCSATKERNVKVTIAHVFFVPNAFTPEENGVNSTFGPIGEEMNFASYSFAITNNKGETVFATHDANEQWNGKYNNNGAALEGGVYYWIIKTEDNFGNSQTRKGTVTLIK